MKIEYRSFIGNKVKLPKPTVFLDEKLNLIIVSNVWGDNGASEAFINSVVDYYGGACADSGATSPFPRIPTLSTEANNIRMSIILASQRIYSEFNENEYSCGVETFVMARSKNELIWFSTKGFCLILYKDDRSFPLQTCVPLSVQSQNKDKTVPLPLELVGLNANEYVIPGSIKGISNDKLILLLGNYFDPQLMDLDLSKVTLDNASKILSSDGENPFWLGVVEF